MKFGLCDSLWKRIHFSNPCSFLPIQLHLLLRSCRIFPVLSNANVLYSSFSFLSLRPWFPLLYFPKWGSVISKQKNAANRCHLGSSEVLPYGNSAFFKLACGVPAHSNGLRWKRISGREHCHELGWRKGS